MIKAESVSQRSVCRSKTEICRGHRCFIFLHCFQCPSSSPPFFWLQVPGNTCLFNTSLTFIPNFPSSISSSLMWAGNRVLRRCRAQIQEPLPITLLTPKYFLGRNLEFLLSVHSGCFNNSSSMSKISFRTKHHLWSVKIICNLLCKLQIICKSKFVLHLEWSFYWHVLSTIMILGMIYNVMCKDIGVFFLLIL